MAEQWRRWMEKTWARRRLAGEDEQHLVEGGGRRRVLVGEDDCLKEMKVLLQAVMGTVEEMSGRRRRAAAETGQAASELRRLTELGTVVMPEGKKMAVDWALAMAGSGRWEMAGEEGGACEKPVKTKKGEARHGNGHGDGEEQGATVTSELRRRRRRRRRSRRRAAAGGCAWGVAGSGEDGGDGRPETLESMVPEAGRGVEVLGARRRWGRGRGRRRRQWNGDPAEAGGRNRRN